jgi:probable HAF family extracellular repeat protein
MLSLRAAVTLTGWVLIPFVVIGAAPNWWSEHAVLNPNQSSDDYALVNQGQLKNIAAAAVAEFDKRLPSGARDILHSLVEGWNQPNAQRNEFAPVNLGQLKNAVKPFYDCLIAVGFVNTYPWVGAPNSPDDFAIANIGQVKNLFSFDLLATDVGHDSDQNGLPDWWERYYFGHLGVDPAGDGDGDGLTNLEELQRGTNPTDYSNDGPAQITIVGGDQQKGLVVSWLPEPLVVKVAGAGGQSLVNAPVQFSVVAGDARVEASTSDVDLAAASVTLRSDPNGLVSAFVFLGLTPNERKSIQVQAGNAGIVTFSAASFPVAEPFVTCGSYSSFDFDANRTLWEWGANSSGQLGDGSVQERGVPIENLRVNNVRDIVGGNAHTIALKWDGTVWTWGANWSGQLGDNTAANRTFPAIVPNLADVAAVAAGDSHSIALKQDGTVWAWGSNFSGQLGNGTFDDSSVPVQVITESGAVLDNVVAVATGSWHSLALRSDGTVWTWGANWSGQLGDGTTSDHWAAAAITLPPASQQASTQVMKVIRLTNSSATVTVTKLVAGGSHSLALLSDGTALAWGGNWNGQLGTGNFDDSLAPVAVAGLTNAIALAAGDSHNLALRSNGTIWAWGNNSSGQLGIAGTAVSEQPLQVPNLLAITSIAAGYSHSLARASDGVVWSFGSNDHGQLGRKTSVSLPTATDVDADHNGLSDAWERQRFGTAGQNSYGDADHDGLTNLQEYEANTDPNNPDSDGDGVLDGQDGWANDPDFSPPRLPDSHYALIDLGPGTANALNSNSDVVGTVPAVGFSQPQGFLWQQGQRIQLGEYSMRDINDSGQMIGSIYSAGYVWPSAASGPVLLTMPADPNSAGYHEGDVWYVDNPSKISNAGVIIGQRVDSGRDYVYNNASISVYGTNNQFTSVFGVILSAINDAGILTGGTDSGSAARVEGSSVTQILPALPAPYRGSFGFGISNIGDANYGDDIVGYSSGSYSVPDRACVWSHGKVIDLGDLEGAFDTYANAINNKRQIVGGGGAYPGDRAFLWQNQTMHDLDKLVPADAGVHLYWASDINENGCIAASGYNAQGQTHAYLLVPVELVADFNRDGRIDDRDRNTVTSENPYRFWMNDDDDSGELGGDDVPNSTYPDYATNPRTGLGSIDGTRDLVDFFPLFVDVRGLLQVLPADRFMYKLKQEDGALNFVTTDLEPESAGDFLRKLSNSTALDNASALGTGGIVQQVTSEGVTLDQDWLSKITTERKGVILLEGSAATHKPLVLEVTDRRGMSVVKIPFQVSIDGVEKMFRHSNFIGQDAAFGRRTEMREPANYPDSLCDDRTFVFVHGFYVSPEEARGWNSEMFKRMHWAGSKAKFVGITWNSSETNGTTVPDYHKNVDNAFSTAPPFAALLNSLGPSVTVAAHSLGNLVVGSAIQDWGAEPANYFMIDSAVPLEAYDGNTATNDAMIHPDWISYRSASDSNYIFGDRTFASEWYLNPAFPSGDARKTLTWRDRLSRVGANTYNFFSSTEDVLRKHEGDPGVEDVVEVALTGGRYSWALQEKLKGRQVSVSVGHIGSTYGGWLFSLNVYPPGPVSPEQASQLSDTSLTSDPVFDPGFTLRISPPPPENEPPPKGYSPWRAGLDHRSD